MESIDEVIKKLSELQARGKSTNQLRKMEKDELINYENDLSDFIEELAAIPLEDINDEQRRNFKVNAEILKNRLEEEKWKRGWKGTLGFKREVPKKDAPPVEKPSEKEIKRFNEELKKIQEERLVKSKPKYEPNKFSSESRSILTSAVDEFRHALTPPLLDADVHEIQRKRDALDAAKATRNIMAADGATVQGVFEKMKRFAKGSVSVLGEFTEETTGGAFKATALFLGWPLILPIKVANQVFTAAKYSACLVDGVFGFLDKGLDGFIGKLKRDGSNNLIYNAETIIKGVAHGVLRGPILLVRGVSQAASIGFRWLERHIDADKWLKYAPVTGGFAIGGVGAAVLIGLTLASIPGLGIPLAVAALAFAVATIGAVAQGYFKAKEKAKLLSSLELNSKEATQLEKYEYDHQVVHGLTEINAKEKDHKAQSEIATHEKNRELSSQDDVIHAPTNTKGVGEPDKSVHSVKQKPISEAQKRNKGSDETRTIKKRPRQFKNSGLHQFGKHVEHTKRQPKKPTTYVVREHNEGPEKHKPT